MIPDEVRKAIRDCAKYTSGCTNNDAWRDTARQVFDWLDALPQPPRPDWSQAPDEAEWWTMNANGCADWSVIEPFPDEDLGAWRNYEGAVWDAQEGKIPLGIDWRTLKQRRPEQEPQP